MQSQKLKDENEKLRKALSDLNSRHTKLIVKYYTMEEKYNKLLNLENNLQYYKESLKDFIETVNK